jgi:hypothetical protein
MDAVDIMNLGTGLTGTAGDGVSTPGAFADFLTADEGTSTARWGVISSIEGILYVNGVLTIGTSTATEFDDANVVVVFPDQYVTTGFCGLDFGMANTGQVIDMLNCSFIGAGALYTSDDTRPDYTATGTSGALTFTGCTFNTFRQIDFTTAVSAIDCVLVNGLLINAVGASFAGSTFLECTGAADSSYLVWNTATNPNTALTGCTFEKGTTATHAIELGLTSPIAITLTNVTFTGYGADTTTSAAIYVKRTAGTVTISWSGGTAPTYKSDGATVVVQSTKILTVTVQEADGTKISGARVGIYKLSDRTEIHTGTTTAGGIVQKTDYNYSGDTDVYIRARLSPDGASRYVPSEIPGTITTNGLNVVVTLFADEIAA